MDECESCELNRELYWSDDLGMAVCADCLPKPVGLYDENWNLIDVFDSRPDAMNHVLYNSIPAFKIKEL